ncbi:hypothetical protein VPH35_047590 [Triticum aestivum]
MEIDLTNYLATGWRFSAHAIGPGVFVVRFPNPRSVAQICYVGRVTLKTTGVVIHASPWSSAMGSKGVMEVAWVRISNVPLDKRSERNLAYVASLVGVPLEIDAATLHRPTSVRVKLGCRNVDAIPVIAEAVLGGHFYDFLYEVDQVVVRDPEREKNDVQVSPKSGKENSTHQGARMTPGAQMGSSSAGLGGKSSSIPRGEVSDPIQESQESLESDGSLHNSLLIETMVFDQMACDDKVLEANNSQDAGIKETTDYIVESPELTVGVESKMERVDDKAIVVAKKRNMEGLMVGVNREAMERGAKMLKTNAAAMMRICAAPAGSAMD